MNWLFSASLQRQNTPSMHSFVRKKECARRLQMSSSVKIKPRPSTRTTSLRPVAPCQHRSALRGSCSWSFSSSSAAQSASSHRQYHHDRHYRQILHQSAFSDHRVPSLLCSRHPLRPSRSPSRRSRGHQSSPCCCIPCIAHPSSSQQRGLVRS